ncbi:hypothetical protein LLS47_23715 [Rouxiella badensis]|uniref:hypothetical protein n=1 Tax=Rouxiella badensis TaxID=1646377 RepID=UPI001D15051D|nr:hypothetical protein [Rouxiella badensis]MCC3735911.1 hypothetical protein [Rouxiella badensis]MCC3761308.1 hypothetical protein [Rouxiella badensis]
MTDTKKEKTEKSGKKGAAWLDDFETFQNVALETSFAQNTGTYWNYKVESLGDIQAGTTPYVRSTVKVTKHDDARLINVRIPAALEAKLKEVSFDIPIPTLLLICADYLTDELIKENKQILVLSREDDERKI